MYNNNIDSKPKKFCFIRIKKYELGNTRFELEPLLYCLGLAVLTLLWYLVLLVFFFRHYDCNTIIYNFYLGVHVTMKEKVMTS